jgi:hypothetical protein
MGKGRKKREKQRNEEAKKNLYSKKQEGEKTI